MWGLRAAVVSAGVLVPSVGAAAPIELVSERGQFWLFDDASESIEGANWFFRDPFLFAYGDVEDGFLAVHPDDSQFLVMFTTFHLPPPIGALYQAVANDVRGIGYEHIAELDAVIPEPYFDDTPGSQVQGFLHMNAWTQYIGGDAGGLSDSTISLVFGQEFGHAWLAFPWYADDLTGELRDDLLGRSDAHWSFYVDSGGSPVQGHAWTDNGDGTFTAQKTAIFKFSPLDLYLMGLVPDTEVPPFFVLDNVHDCVDSALRDGECAPQDAFAFEADSYTVSATRRDVTIEQIIAAEGPRIPAFGDAPTSWDVSFILVKRPDETLSAEELAKVDAIVARSIELFELQTGGRGHIVNRTQKDGPPDPIDDDDSGSGDGSTTDDGAAGIGSASGIPLPDTEGGPGLLPIPNEDNGCACRTSAGRTVAFALFALVPFVRRRQAWVTRRSRPGSRRPEPRPFGS